MENPYGTGNMSAITPYLLELEKYSNITVIKLTPKQKKATLKIVEQSQNVSKLESVIEAASSQNNTIFVA